MNKPRIKTSMWKQILLHHALHNTDAKAPNIWPKVENASALTIQVVEEA